MANTLNLGNGNWATKEDSLLAYNSENGNFKPLPFDFTRASSATVVNKAGLIETVGSGEPRIDFSNDAKGALLLEPQRSNLFYYSEDFNNWSKSGWTLTSGLLAPNGNLDAYSVLRTTGSTFAQSLTLSSNTTYTFSAYIKNVNATNIQLRVQNQAGNTSGTESNCIVFSVTDQTSTSNFTRITHTFNTGDAGSYGLFLGYYSAGEYIVWGAQLEQGSYATSYIPTQGGAVTRVLDASSQTVPSGVKIENQGSLYFEFNSSYLEAYSQRILTISEDVSNLIEFQLASANLLTFVLVKSGQSGVVITKSAPSITLGENTKIAAAFSNGDFVFYVNGTLIGTDTDPSKSVPTISDIKFSRYNSTTPFIGSVNNLKLYNTRLSNAELQALTK